MIPTNSCDNNYSIQPYIIVLVRFAKHIGSLAKDATMIPYLLNLVRDVISHYAMLIRFQISC